MAEGRLLRQLVRAGAAGDRAEFRTAAEAVIQEERAKKHHLLANDLERVLYGEVGGLPATRQVYDIPKDSERGAPLLTVRAPVRTLDDLVLAAAPRTVLDEVLVEFGRDEVLRAHGLRPIQRLLFCGPPGCGKTSAAEVLACELRMELVTVRFDAVVSSFLGETSANLRKVFDFVQAGRFVVLFDEFDAIGKEREDASEHGELRRVVNSFLQLLDSYRGQSLLVAATNHEGMLDRALWRRFDEVVALEPPSAEEIGQLLRTKLRGVRHEVSVEEPSLLAKFRGLSHADVERVVIRAVKAMVLAGREFLTQRMLEDALAREERRLVAAGFRRRKRVR